MTQYKYADDILYKEVEPGRWAPVDDKENQIQPYQAPHQAPREVQQVETVKIPAPQMQQTAQAVVQMKTSHVDRAQGFLLSNWPLAGSFGLLAVLIAMLGWEVPFFSIGTLVLFWLFFAAWWVVSYLINMALSSDAAVLWQAILGYRLIRHEQKHRFSKKRDDHE